VAAEDASGERQMKQATSHLRTLAELGLVLLLGAMAIVFIAFGSGCAETKADFTQHKKIIDPDTGLVVYEKTTDTGAFSRAPSDASGPTTQSVNEQGVSSSVSGVHTKTAEQIIAGNSIVFYWVAAGFAVAAIVGVTVLKSRPLAIGFGIAAGASALTPTFLNEVGPWLLPVGGLAAAIALVWYLADRYHSNQSSRLAASKMNEGERLKEQGKYVEALDAMSSAKDVLAVNKPVFRKGLKP